MADQDGIGVVFFDVRDTLGEVDRPGHLVPYRPSTEKLLEATKALGVRIGVITNLPDDVSADQGRQMVGDAVLSEDPQSGSPRTIMDFLDSDLVVINHEAGLNKPDPAIFAYAAERAGVPIERCAFVGENLIEVLAARRAGMHSHLKPCPPGREFQPAVVTKLGGETERDSGRAFEDFLEHEHLLGDRIFNCAQKIAEELKSLKEGDPIPENVQRGSGLLMYLLNNFADQAHFAAEEAAIPIALARGMDRAHSDWVYLHHHQARAYWRGMTLAWERMQTDDATDVWYAIGDFRRLAEAFVILFRHHAERENDELYPEMGRHFSDTDDTLVLNLLATIGPRDFTPYVGLVADMEQALDLPPAGG
jgi:hemerythrin-like domain-containing protein/beta-phosphoglucomutase-like phosphatase (HAD superfamily)